MRTASSPASASAERAAGIEPLVFMLIDPRLVRRRIRRMARAISFQRSRGSPSQPCPKLTMVRPPAVARCSAPTWAISSAEGARRIRSWLDGGMPSAVSDRQPTQRALQAAEAGMAPSSRP